MSQHPARMTPSERLDYIATLENDWDSYGAPPIDPRAIAEARRLLADWPGDLPTPTPTTSGGIALEFDNDDEGITILPDGSVLWEDE